MERKKIKKTAKNNGRVCFIGGTSLMNSDLFRDFSRLDKKNKFGRVTLFQKGNLFFIQRHLHGVPPHKINFRAYFEALDELGVKKIISICSVGTLKKNMKLPAVMLPHDFISFWNIPTFFDDKIFHAVPGISDDIKKMITDMARKLNLKIHPKGVYFQTNGPRIETFSEIKLASKFADVVGMTFAQEAALASEKNIGIAAICTIDNYANGLSGEIDYEKVKKGAEKNRRNLEKLLSQIIKGLVKS